jgi:hypothetical protein
MAKRILYTLGLVVVLSMSTWAGAETASTAFEGEELLPPSAKAGECYARVFVPPTYKIVSEQTLKRQAAERIEIVPARFEWIEETVMAKGPGQRLEVIPATYEWVEETMMVKSESTRIEEIPAVYETLTERVMDSPAHVVWKKGRGPIQRLDNSTGEIMCLVEVPATYKTLTKRVLAKPAATRELVIPAEFKTVRRQVMKTPPATRTIEIPADYAKVKVRKLVSPAQIKKIPIPAEFQTVTRQEMVTEGRMEWTRIMCETNITSDVVVRIQRALLNAGHDPGPIDGVIGVETMGAVKAFQTAKGLAVGNLTYETLKSLGVKITPPASS